ncbi:cell division cycle- protein [Basidiobolus ranarum]|uniref:Cell division cycle- protein n=1 Tax=Basidiobolus ranarum TaxID=34480 RepID=A0ABR2VV91_9FUNG
MAFHAKKIVPHIANHTTTKYPYGRLRVLDIDPIELARQLTLFDSYLYNQIKPVECMHEAWRHTEPWMAVNIKEVLKVFQQVKYWVAYSILGEKDSLKRAHTIESFINMASYCSSWNNYNTCMAILEGLNMAPVASLQQTWLLINTKHRGCLENLRKLMSPSSNFRLYRANLMYLTTPCVPYLHTYLDDWENNSADVDVIISEVERHQGSYRFSVLPELLLPIIQELQEYGTLGAVIKLVKLMEGKYESNYDVECTFLEEESRYPFRPIQY